MFKPELTPELAQRTAELYLSPPADIGVYETPGGQVLPYARIVETVAMDVIIEDLRARGVEEPTQEDMMAVSIAVNNLAKLARRHISNWREINSVRAQAAHEHKR